MIISHNLAALRLTNNNKAEKAHAKALGRLQSGLRVRTVADDSAALGISENMRAQIRGLQQAARNIQDGISLVQTADGALGRLNDPPLQRMREVAVQAANDTLTEDDRQKIQAEIQQLKGNMDDIFHNTEFNTQKIFVQIPPPTVEAKVIPVPGVLLGDTILRSSGLVVTPGENQILTFKLDGQPYSISLNSGAHTTQQLLDDINQKLEAAGTDVTASYSGDNIALYSPTKVIDSFGGDMMEINDPYTSILYDMAKPGLISGAAVRGYGSLPASLTITDNRNDSLTLTVDGANQSIVLSPGTYNPAGLVNEINTQLNAANSNVTASLISGGTLQLMHNISGGGHTLTNVFGTAYPDLFQQYTTLQESVLPPSYLTAGITGYRALSAGITITAGVNDTLNFAVDGSPYTITLSAGSNIALSDIIDDLNTKFAANTPPLPLVAGSSSGCLRIAYNTPGIHTVDNFSGNAADDLLYGMGAAYVRPGSYKYVEGSSTPLPNGYAYVRGVTDLSGGVTVAAGVNDTFNFRVDGVNQTITLNPGNYTVDTLLTNINNKLSGLNVVAEKYNDYSGTYITFRNIHEGGGIAQFPYSLDSFSGNGYDALMRTLIPKPTAGTDSKARVYGRADLSAGLAVTAGVNDTLSFKVTTAGGSSSNISITLPEQSYSKDALLTEINNQLTSSSARVTASYSGNQLLLTAQDSGSRIDTIAGNAVDALLRTKSYVGWAFYSSSASTDAYVEGRLDLAAGVIIGQGANDTLTFDLNGSSQSITLADGSYSAEGLLAALNDQLSAYDVTASYNAKGRLRLTYAPGVNGSYVIDGVGGNASYTLFYPGPEQTVTAEKDAGPVKTANMLKLHVGARAGMNISTGIPMFMSTRVLGVHALNVTTQAGAETAITAIDKAISQVSQSRSHMGSLRNGLEYTLNNVSQYHEQLTAAESAIRDANVAAETMELTKSSILMQVVTAMQVQANQKPESILQLLN